jgi:hypothetical protein
VFDPGLECEAEAFFPHRAWAADGFGFGLADVFRRLALILTAEEQAKVGAAAPGR